MKHSLTLDDRGEGHVHRYIPRCSCGWSGPNGRRQTAERYYHHHLSVVDARQHTSEPRPRQVTPTDQLPDELKE